MSTIIEQPQGAGNPLENEPGLSQEDNQKAIKLRWDHHHADREADELDRRSRQSYRRSFGRELNEIIEEVKAHKAVKRIGKEATKHYKQNEAAYQVQAVKDAAKEGVHTNFGT